MRLRVFHAADGDCLLLSSSDDHHVLVDGGRTTTFRDHAWGTLRAMARQGEGIDLVVVSHVDADHISGVIWLMKAVAAWAVYDYQVGEAGNRKVRPPSMVRPPRIDAVWHNAWRAQVGDLAGEIEALAARVSEAVQVASDDSSSRSPVAVDLLERLQDLAESIPDGVELRRVIEDDTPIPPQPEMIMLRERLVEKKVGATTLTVIGPAAKHLEKLREEWRRWLEDKRDVGQPGQNAAPGNGGAPALALNGIDAATAIAAWCDESNRLVASLANAADVIAETDPSKVSPPNRASILLLAEEDGRTCLLTGDAAEEEILHGLRATGRVVNGRFSCNVLKVQHHGSEHNLSREFAETVVADHYVFCGDGAHGNPNPSVVRTITETRPADAGPYTISFNCSPERTLPSRRAALRAAIREATAARRKHAGVTVKVLDDKKGFFDIDV